MRVRLVGDVFDGMVVFCWLRESLRGMERSEIEAISRRIELERRANEPAKVARPLGITAIAGLQLLKGAVLVLTGSLLRLKPESVGPDSALYPLLYVATRGKYDAMTAALQGGNALPGLLLFLGFYLGAIGVGILSLGGWARRTLIFTCGMTLALWAKTCLWPDPAVASSSQPDMTNFYVLLAIDAGVFLYLLRGNTAQMFEVRG